MNAIAQRNHCFDFIKGIACVCVVFMHCEFPGKMGILVQCVSRFCVPFFFMLSGYYSFSTSNKVKSTFRKARHILNITVWSYLFYFCFYFVKWILGKGAGYSVNFKAVLSFLIFNAPLFSTGQLWFLFALLYVYLVYAIIDKAKLTRQAYAIIPLLLLGYVFLAQGLHLFGYKVPNCYYRNFLFEGLFFFLLGHYFHNREEWVMRLDDVLLVTVLVISTLACIPERLILGRDFGVNICTVPQVAACFILGMKHKTFGRDSFLEYFGMNFSMLIYVLHPFVIQVQTFSASALGLSGYLSFKYAMPILTLLFTVALSWVCKTFSDCFLVGHGKVAAN